MKKRVALWDNIKFFLILSVVVGHLIDWHTAESGVARSIFLFIYTYHMPLFIFISGLFYSNRNIRSKCMYYLSVGFALKMVMGIYSFLTGNGFYFSLLSDGGIPWFMFVLAMFTFVTYCLGNANKYFVLVASIILACFVGYDASVGDFLYLSRTIVFFPCFYLGVMVDANKILELKEKQPKAIFVALAMVVLVGLVCLLGIDHVYIYRYLLTGRNAYYLEIMSYAMLARLGCYFISLIMGISIIFIAPIFHIPFITKAGSNSINIYFWHYVVYCVLEEVTSFSKLYEMGILGKLAFILCGLIIVVICAQERIFSFPLKQIKEYCYSQKTVYLGKQKE